MSDEPEAARTPPIAKPIEDEPTNTGDVETDERPDPRMLDLLVCPLTKTRLSYDRERQELVSRAAGLAFPIRNGVPLMTLEAARELD